MRHRRDDPFSGRLYRSSEYPEVPEVSDPVVSPVEAAPEPTADVPEPVRKAGWVWGTLATFITTTLGVLVAVGKVSQEQADSLNYGVAEIGNYLPGLVGALVGIVGVVSGIVSHVATSEVGRRSVKPVPEARARGTVR